MNGTQHYGTRKGDGGGDPSFVSGASAIGAGPQRFSSQPDSEQSAHRDRSFVDLLGDISHGLLSLVRDEMELAKTEMTQKAERTGKDLAYIGVGAAVCFVGFMALVAALAAGLALFMPLWLSCLIVGVVVGAVGFFLLRNGLKRLEKEDMVPRETLETLKEQEEWLKERMT
jgi:hypothetical protein